MNELQLENSIKVCLDFYKSIEPDVILPPNEMRVIREFIKACPEPITQQYQCRDSAQILTLSDENDNLGPYYDPNGVQLVIGNLFKKYPNISYIMAIIVSYQKIIYTDEVNGLIPILEKLPKDIFNNLCISVHSSNYIARIYEQDLSIYLKNNQKTS